MFKRRRERGASGRQEPRLDGSATDRGAAPQQVDGDVAPKKRTATLANGVIKVGRRSYAVGLTWTFKEGGSRVSELAGRLGEQMNRELDLYVAAGDSKDQVGLGTRDEGHLAGQLVAALAIDPTQRGGDCLCAFMIGENAWWIIAFQDGRVVADEVRRELQQAHDLFSEQFERRVWAKVLAPADWEGPDFRAVTIEQVLRLGPKLRAVSPVRMHRVRFLIAACFALVVGGGYYYWTEVHDAQLREQEAAEAAARESSRQGRVPWRDAPTLSAFVDACNGQIELGQFDAPGWVSSERLCIFQNGRASLSLAWKRDSGRFNWLDAAWRQRGGTTLGSLSLAPNGEIAELALPVDVGAVERRTDVPLDPGIIEGLVRKRFQAFGVAVEIREYARPISPEQRKKLRAPQFDYHQVTVTTQGGLQDLVALLAGIPAIAPSALQFDPTSGIWQLVVLVYHPPIMPEK